MQLTDLTGLGLSKDEASVYLALLELGGSYVSAIARKSKVHRVNCYKVLDNLVQKGLISSFTKNKVKHFSVENPQLLVLMQEEKLHKANKILPELLSITNTLAYKPKIQYYEGMEGLRNIFEDSLGAGDEMLGYTNLDALINFVPHDYIRQYASKKISAGIKTRMLSPFSDQSLLYTKHFYPEGFNENLVEILFINPQQYPFQYEINIYGNKVSVLSLNPEEIIGFIIESKVYADTQRAIFQLAWLGATSFVAR